MASGYILERFDDMSGGYTCNRLQDEARRLDMDLRIIGMRDTFAAGGSLINRGAALERRDFSIIRHRPGAVRDAVCGLTGRSYNDRGLFDRYLNKARQLESVRSDSMRIPDHVLSSGCIGFDRLADMLGVPFVMKGLEGSRGDQVHLVRSEEDYDAVLVSEPADKEWLFEEFISSSEGRDLRVFSIRGEPVACMLRSNDRDFRANFALGARLEPFEADDSIRSIAADVYRSVPLDVAGIDLLFGRDGYCFCEVNVMPGIKGIESVTGVNVAAAIMRTVQGDLNGKR